MKKSLISLSLGLSLGLISCTSQVTETVDTEPQDSVISIENPRIRTPLGQNPNTGGYMIIKNTGSEADTLLSVSCDCAESVEIHEMKHEAGMMKMQPVMNGLSIAPGKEVTLAPGGLHLMIMAVKPEMRTDNEVELKLEFAKAKTVIVEAELTDKP
jgi:periplasmic copper chaperone A